VAFAKELRKTTVSFDISARPSSVRPHGTTGLPLDDLVKTGIGDFRCSLSDFAVPLKTGENNKKLSKKTNAYLLLLWLLILRST
jgi:hypothetical protein